MKKVLMAVMVGLMCQGAALAETYRVDAAQSSVEWYATKVTGAHNGNVSVSSGRIEFEDGKMTGGEAVIDMTSIAVLDIENPGKNRDLVDHLKNPDFFDVMKYPKAALKVTSVTSTGKNSYNVTADFTIKNMTHPVSFPAVVKMTDGGVRATAKITIDRTLYDVRYGSGKFFENLGNRIIHDEFKLSVSIQAGKE